jgi:hypothetical protein
MKFRKYLTELRQMKYGTPEHFQAMRDAHRQLGSVIWIYSVKSKTIVWAYLGHSEMYINNKKVSISRTAKHWDKADTHGDILDALEGYDEKLEKTFYPWDMTPNGRIAPDGRIAVYDEKQFHPKHVNWAIDAIYKYVKI